MSFVHLHVHSEYSLLDGFSNIKKLVARAKELEMPALALTDHGTMFGVIDFYNAATAAGIKPIVGVESYLAPRGMSSRDPQFDKKATHLLLLAQNETGYRNLLQIASAAQLEGFYYYPRVDHEFLGKHAEGLICTSGCMSAEVPKLIQQGDMEGARKRLDWYYDTFGADNFFLELQQHDIKELDNINKMLIDLGRRYQARFVATNDVHYINKEDARLQDILLAIQTGCLISDPNRMRMTDASYHLRTPEEMGRLFAEIPEALSNTLLIAERCNIDLGFKGYHLPLFEVPDGTTTDGYLRQLCEAGLQRRFGARANDPVVRQRLDYELGVIHQMGFDTYFLIVWDLCRYARERGIWYNARGSAAGSIVAYTLEITLVDPIEHGLIFERFLNPGRISMPDIDLDFRDDRRAEMIEYTAHKYGEDKVAQIVTFGTLGARAALRDVGRVMDIPLNDVDRVAKMVPNIPGKPVTIEQALEEVTEFKQAYNSAPYLKELIDTASQMEGVVRNAGTHAAGVIITDKPIIEYIPLHRPTGQSAADSPVKIVTQFEMSVLDSLGLLKVDFLGLDTLTIMALACDLIRERHGVDFNLNNIPTDDPVTYELLGRGETAGVFQVEGSGMRRYLMQMKPKELANVIAMVALFRPGPMDFIPGYIRRMHGEEEVQYRHPALESVLKETYGITVYQEQIMYSAMQLAGYSASEADNLRKGVAKKKADVLLKHRQTFVEGAVKNGIPSDVANQIFDDWEAFARYGFPKGHAADYGVISVQTAYLKVHYPVEYMTAVLSVRKTDNAKVALYVADCRRMGISVEPPDINASQWDFSIEDRPGDKPGEKPTPVIRFGLGAVKNVGQGPVTAILKGREDGKFANLNDFARRADLRQVGKRALESLVKVGALDKFGTRSALLEALDRIISVSSGHFRAAEVGQLSLFGTHTGVQEDIVLPKSSAEFSRREILNWERELIGLYVSDHPLSPVMAVLTEVVTHFSGQLSEVNAQEKVRVAGLVTRVRHHQSKAGKPMAFVTLEDLQGTVDLVIFPTVWAKFSAQIEVDRIILVDGRVDNNGAEAKILVDNVSTEFSRATAASAGQVVTPVPAPAFAAPDTAEPAMIEPEEVRESAVVGYDPNPTPTVTETPVPGSTHTSSSPANESLPDAAEPWDDEMPPPPDAFPMDWDFEGESFPPDVQPVIEPVLSVPEILPGPLPQPAAAAVIAAGYGPAQPVIGRESLTVEPVHSPTPVSTQAPAEKDLEPVVVPDQEETKPVAVEADEPPPPSPAPISGQSWLEPPVGLPPFLVPPPRGPEQKGKIEMITVVLRSTGDKTRDVLRLRRIHGIITSYPGNDRFAFQVFERGRGYLVEFPNDTAGVCNELLTRLTDLLGHENVRIEPITFQ